MFTGLTALISALTGLFGSSVPKIFELFEKGMSYKQELAIRELEHKYKVTEWEWQLKLAQQGASAKLDESIAEAFRAEIAGNTQTLMEVLQQTGRPTGFRTLDAINQSIRPVFFICTLTLFLYCMASAFIMDPKAFQAQMITLFAFTVEGVIGWAVGYRVGASRLLTSRATR